MVIPLILRPAAAFPAEQDTAYLDYNEDALFGMSHRHVLSQFCVTRLGHLLFWRALKCVLKVWCAPTAAFPDEQDGWALRCVLEVWCVPTAAFPAEDVCDILWHSFRLEAVSGRPFRYFCNIS